MIETNALTLHADGRPLLRDFTWRAGAAERWCVIGRNAAGKSTLLRALAGLDVPRREGEVRWLGRPQRAWPAADAAAVRAFAAQQAVDRFPLRVSRLLELSRVVAPGRDATATLQALDVAHLGERNVMRLSGGERQRVALAQCALQGAPLLLMDEPVAFQDPAHQTQVARWLRSLTDATLVISAHDVNWIAALATHVVALHGDGGWSAGIAASILQPPMLQRVYGCRWRRVGELWIADA